MYIPFIYFGLYPSLNVIWNLWIDESHVITYGNTVKSTNDYSTTISTGTLMTYSKYISCTKPEYPLGIKQVIDEFVYVMIPGPQVSLFKYISMSYVPVNVMFWELYIWVYAGINNVCVYT